MKFKRVKEDSFLFITVRVFAITFFLHLYQFYDSGFLTQPIIRAGFCVLYILSVFIWGRKGSYFVLFLNANYLALTMDFQNYTAFIIIALLGMLIPKHKYHLFLVYLADVIVVATLHDKTPVHIAIHLLNCTVLYYVLYFLMKPTTQKKKLNLTLDETLILDELLQGKQQKEIERFSQNTVTNKLKQAKMRNGIPTTEELLKIYLEIKENE